MTKREYEADGYFAVEMKPGIYLLSHEYGERGVHWGRGTAFGSPTGNSWLIKGSERSLLIDSALPHEGFRAFAEEIAGTPVQLILTHGHYDHIFRLREFDEFWIHPEDERLLRGEFPIQPAYEGIPGTIHYLDEGDELEIGGGHRVEVYHVPGHSDGSILLYDRRSRSLFGSDTIARRLLYGLGKWVPLDQFIRNIARLRELDFDRIFTCHDRLPLSKQYIDYMIESLYELPRTTRTIEILGSEFIHLIRGEERDERYFDCVVPAGRREEIAQALESDSLA